MDDRISSDVAFTPAVKRIQEERGSRRQFLEMENDGGWRTTIIPALADYLATRDSFYLGSASRDGQPYIQHRGGPPGFIRVLKPSLLGFIDFAGNRQYISTGNFSENRRAIMFVMDYQTRRRIKIWGTARVIALTDRIRERFMPPDYRARPEQAILFRVKAWDTNCQQHIPKKYDAKAVESTLQSLRERIEALENENRELRERLGSG